MTKSWCRSTLVIDIVSAEAEDSAKEHEVYNN